MNLGSLLAYVFEKIPEWSIKNDLRYFLAFNKLVPNFVKSISPVAGYEMYYHLKEGDVVVDAGAYPGDYAVFASRKVGNSGKVICFEPDPKNRKMLRKNLEAERRNNFIIVPKGLWNKDTTLKLKSSDGLHSNLSKETGQTLIDVAKLDNELKKLKIKKIDVLKMDIEGAEIEAIAGCRSTLKKNKVHVAIASYHIVDGKTTSHFLENYLSKLGYNVKSDFPKHLTTYAWKPARESKLSH
jgi:FkbM family methyltransferase